MTLCQESYLHSKDLVGCLDKLGQLALVVASRAQLNLVLLGSQEGTSRRQSE